MDRWTIKELKDTSDLKFAQLILAERRSKVSPYSPLGQKLAHVIGVLREIEISQTEREYLVDKTIDNIFELLPHEEAHIWTDGDEILCDTENRAEAIADLLDAINGEQTANTGYYDPEEDERNNEVTKSTGYYYVNVA